MVTEPHGVHRERTAGCSNGCSSEAAQLYGVGTDRPQWADHDDQVSRGYSPLLLLGDQFVAFGPTHEISPASGSFFGFSASRASG